MILLERLRVKPVYRLSFALRQQRKRKALCQETERKREVEASRETPAHLIDGAARFQHLAQEDKMAIHKGWPLLLLPHANR
jgi:hypothetical protein